MALDRLTFECPLPGATDEERIAIRPFTGPVATI
jgi:hypothetical protein